MGVSGIVRNYNAGSIVINENDISRKMFIIKEGKARVFRSYLSQKITLAVLGPGEIFGELSFFDAEPRSASVEALTSLTAVEIDGDNMQSELENIPNWFFPMLKTVFHRFRQADQRITVLQSMYEYKKKNFGDDDIARTTYLELLRYFKILTILREKFEKSGGEIRKKELAKELDDLTGKRTLSLRVFWSAMSELDFLDSAKDEQGIFAPHQKKIDPLIEYLNVQVKNETYLLLTHSALAIIKRILNKVGQMEKEKSVGPILIKDLGLTHVPLHQEALTQLQESKILKIVDGELKSAIPPLVDLFVYQTFLKAFDHTQTHVD